MDAARLGLPKFLKAIPPEEMGHYGFADPAEVQVAELGTPFRLFTISRQQILDDDPATPLETLVLPLAVARFPVVVKGQSRALLYVEMTNGPWRAVGIGSSGIAKLWAAAQAVRPTTAGHANLFVRVFQARADFVLSTKDGTLEMIRLSSAGTSPDALQRRHDPAEVIVSLQPSVLRGSMPEDALRSR